MKLHWKIKNFIKGVKNIFYYLPIIWRDRDWDHAFHEYLMYAKLKKHYKAYTSTDLKMPYEDMEKHIQAMKICINIMDRRRDDWYCNVWHERWGKKQEMVFGEPVGEGKQTRKISFVGLTDEENELSRECLFNCHKVEERDWNIFCDIYKKYFNYWWT